MKNVLVKRLGLIAQISIFKTLRFNCHYFGRGGVKLPIIVSRNVKFMELGGSVHFVGKHGRVFLGFGSPGVADRKKEKMLFQNTGEIIFNGKCYLSPGCKIVNTGTISFGDDFSMKPRSTIISDCNIKF